MAKRWVAMRNEYSIYADRTVRYEEVTGERVTEQVFINKVPQGQVGFVVEEPSMQWGHKAGEGQVVVQFPQTMRVFDESMLDEVSPYDFETSMSILRDYEGHRCRSGEYQFNIKFYHWNRSPKAEELLTGDELNDGHWTILHDHYECNFKGECDQTVRDMFDWWADEWQDGRSGGWLVVKHNYRLSADDFYHDHDQLKDELESLQSYYGEDELSFDEYKEAVEKVNADMYEIQVDANDLARDLEFIHEHINQLKIGLAEYMETEECWEHLYDYKIEEMEAEEQRKKDLAEGWEAWRTVRNYLEESYFEQDSGIKVIDKINKIMPNY